jgi:hypothetical protein
VHGEGYDPLRSSSLKKPSYIYMMKKKDRKELCDADTSKA